MKASNMKIINSIFKTFLLALMVIANTHFAYAQTASLLPNAVQQFFDNNGKPLSSGTVTTYIPSTTTLKTTWQDANQATPWANPLTLNAAGRPPGNLGIFGNGTYRQVVKDRLGNIIWDQPTASSGSGSGGSTATGDGDLVGTIKPWAGMTAPNQYAFTYGQEVSRTTYAALFTAITSTQAVFCNSGSPTLNGLDDTNNFWIGMSLEISCVSAGFTTITAKTATTVTMATNANVTTNTNAIFFPWGRGNGSTTFNLPDLRGVTLMGNNIMGGVASSRIDIANFSSAGPNSVGGFGGDKSTTIGLINMQGHTHSMFLTDPGHVHVIAPAYGDATAGRTNSIISAGTGAGFTAGSTNLASTGITIRDAQNGLGNANQTTPTGGGIAAGATIANSGSGYTNGAQVITVTGGTCSTQPQFTVTVAGNIFTGSPSLLTAGSCTVTPVNPASTSGGGGSGGTLNVIYAAQPISRIMPTATTNYIIKTTPDSNSATASGVTSFGLMTGDISCGTGLVCAGNNVSVNFPVSNITVGTTGINSGTNTRILFNNSGLLGEYSVSGSGNVAMTSSPVFTTPNLGTPSAVTLTNATGLPVGGITGLGTNVATALAINVGTAGSFLTQSSLGTLTNKTFDSAGTGNTFQISGVTVSRGQYPGIAGVGAATAGNIGEVVSSNIQQASAISITTGTSANVTSISLTAGDWDVWFQPVFRPAATTNTTFLDATISQTSATFANFTDPSVVSQVSFPGGSVLNQVAYNIPGIRTNFSLSGTTTIYAVVQSTHTISTMQAYGFLYARRAR